MGTISPYKVVFTRIGNQESWAGWRIAGYTENTPVDVISQCGKFQAKNADNAKFMFAKYHSEHIEAAKEVYEFSCDFAGQEGKAFTFTRQIFGDSGSGGSTNMIASSICVPIGENEEVLRNPQLLLLVDRTCFDDCKLDSELLIRAAGKTNYGLSEVQTIFPPKEYYYDNSFDINKAIGKVFENKKIFEDFIKCIYWNLTFKSASSVFIKSGQTIEENIQIFLIAINSIVYSYRTKLSFRTFDFEDPTNQPTIVFSDSIPPEVRFFDINTGRNNILTDSVNSKLHRQFMEYYPSNIGTKKAEKFFDLLDKTLIEFGNKNETEVPLLETAFAIMQSELEGSVDQSDKDIIRKIITFCNVPYSNDKIDSYIAGLLDAVIIGDIVLNDDIKNHIDKKLKNTKCPELIDIGNQYRARNILGEEKTAAFKRLLKIKKEDANFNRILEYIEIEPQGKSFIDEFYGKFYGPASVSSIDELIAFSKEAQHISHREQIDKFIKEQCIKYGELLVKCFYDTKLSIVKDMERYENDLIKIYSTRSGIVSAIIKRTCYVFWDKFDFCLFSMNSIQSYQKMYFFDMKGFPRQTIKCGLVSKLVEIFKTAEKQNANTIRAFRNKIDETTLLDDKSRKHLIMHFRKYCLENCDKRHHIDFWLALGDLDTSSRFDYFFDNGIIILTNPDIFGNYIEKSEQLSDIAYLEKYREGLDTYRKTKDSRNIAEIFDITKRYEAKVRKALKSEKRQEKKNDKKQTEDAKPRNQCEKATHKNSGLPQNEDVDFVTDSLPDKSEKRGKFSFGLKNPFKRK